MPEIFMIEPSSIRILYIDDDPFVCDLFKGSVEAHGHIVDVAYNGEDGRAMHATDPYDLLAIDYELPDLNGLEIARRLLLEDQFLPIIMVTGKGSEQIAAEALKLGLSDYIIKDNPQGFADLLPSVIDRALDRTALVKENIAVRTALREGRDHLVEMVEERTNELRMVTDNLPILIAHLDTEQHFLFINKTAELWFNRSADEILGRTIMDVLGDTAHETFMSSLDGVLAGQPLTAEKSVAYPDGVTRDVEISYIPDIGLDGAVKGIFAMVTDIGPRKAAETALRDNERKFHDFADTASDWFWEMDADLRFTYLSESIEEALQQPRPRSLGRTRGEVFADDIAAATPDEQDKWRRHFSDLEARRPFKNFTQRWTTPGGETRFIVNNGKPYFDENGDFAGYRGTGSNITERALAEKALSASEARFRAVFDQAAVGIGLMTSGGRFLSVNQKLCDLMGLNAEALISLRFDQFTHPDDYAACIAQTARLLIGEIDSFTIEMRYTPKDRDVTLWCKLTISIISDPSRDRVTLLGIVEDHTEAKHLDEQLKRTERRFHTLTQGALEGVIIHRDFKLLYVNETVAEISGYSVDELLAMESVLQLVAPADKERLAALGDARLSGEIGSTQYEQQWRKKDGSLIWLRNMARQIDWDGEAAIQSVVVDIDTQKGLEIELRENEARRRENEARLRTILDNAPIAIYMKDTEGRFVFSNRQNAEWYGVDPVSAIGRTTEDYFEPDYAKMAMARDKMAMEKRESIIYEHDIPMRDGGTQHSLIHRVPIIDANGELLGVLGMNQDITERKRAETALREAENRVRDFAEATSDWFWETDAEHLLTHRSSTVGAGDDMAFADRLGKTRFDFEAYDGEARKWQLHREDLAARRPFRDLRYKRPMPGGGVMYSSISGRPFFDIDGTYLGYRGSGKDVTAEVEARNQLVDAIDSMADGVVIFDAEDRLVTFNERYRETYKGVENLIVPGTRFEELARDAAARGLFVDAVGREEDWVRERLENFHQGQNLVEQKMADGTWIQLTERKTPNGYTVGIRTDITELKRREAQLRQSQKLEAVGQLTGGIAHDFNNMLAAIIGNLDLIQEGGGMADDFDRESVDIALRAAHRGAELTHRLLAYSRQQALDAKAVDINQMLLPFSQLARRTIGEDIAIEIKPAVDLWPTMVDAGQLENALLNLAINARDAMPGGGRLNIETANKVFEEDDITMFEDLEPGDYVMIAVSDNGTGMPAEVQQRVFEPFFTTKEVGAGSGLGLSMVFGFARQSGGQVSIYSEEGEGTVVRVFLPRLVDTAVSDISVEHSEKEKPTGRETVLVVEDDEDVRNFLVTALERLGYAVLAAEDGPAALEVMDASQVIDLLLTDMILPRGMNGRDIADVFRERYRNGAVIYSSGYTREVLDRRGGLEKDAVLINKPYRTSALAQQVREVLDGR
ncbi:MAG: PAS domain S-box protein [Rhodospirillaceae bacterium]|nr:PAS domain S-box protein [Rhodospirillaceae bacterium]